MDWLNLKYDVLKKNISGTLGNRLVLSCTSIYTWLKKKKSIQDLNKAKKKLNTSIDLVVMDYLSNWTTAAILVLEQSNLQTWRKSKVDK